MNLFIYYNDTGSEVRIHPATQVHGTKGSMKPIQPSEERMFSLPEGTCPWVKQWEDGTILVSHREVHICEE